MTYTAWICELCREPGVMHVQQTSKCRGALVEALLADESRKPKEPDLLSVWVDEFTKDGTGPLASVDALQQLQQMTQLFEKPVGLGMDLGVQKPKTLFVPILASGFSVPNATVNAALKNAVNAMNADLENAMLIGGGGGMSQGNINSGSTFIVGGGGGWEPQGITFEPGDSGLSSVMNDVGYTSMQYFSSMAGNVPWSTAKPKPIRDIVREAKAEEPKVEAEPGVRQIDLEE